MKFGMMMHLSPPNLIYRKPKIEKNSKTKMADGNHRESRKNHDISETVWAIFTNFAR